MKSAIAEPSITLIQDTREQAGWLELFQTPCTTGTLQFGDYSVLGLEALIAIERKSLPDLLGSLTQGRDRFETELKRARSLHKFYVLVECSLSDLLVQDFGKLSRATPRSIWGTVCTWSTRYHPFIFANDRAAAARLCEGMLFAYAKEFFKGTDAVARASRKVVCMP
jgi:hypothetical protein